ncbi:hypothetical protein TL16_g13282, partial [Triparma laevis f. inornata]
MTSMIGSLNLFGASGPNLSRHPEISGSIKTLRDLDSEDNARKSIAQLEHIKYEYERNLAVMVRVLTGNPKQSDLSVKERQFIGSKTDFYMSRAESLKAVIMEKKDTRDVEQTRRRNSDIARERARKNSLQEETRHRMSDAKEEERRRGGGDRRGSGSSAGFEPTVVATNSPRRKSFTDSHVADKINSNHSHSHRP